MVRLNILNTYGPVCFWTQDALSEYLCLILCQTQGFHLIQLVSCSCCISASRSSSSSKSSVTAENAIISSHLKRPSTESLPSVPLEKRRLLMPRTEPGELVSGTGTHETAEADGEIVWTGQLCLQSTVISDVEMVSYFHTHLPWHL